MNSRRCYKYFVNYPLFTYLQGIEEFDKPEFGIVMVIPVTLAILDEVCFEMLMYDRKNRKLLNRQLLC